MVKITGVEKRSAAEAKGIISGDILVSINGNPIRDVLDYRFYLTERLVSLECNRGDATYTVTIKKGEYDDIGLEFETPLMDKKQTCKNGCIFCFIDQNPEGLRESLYFKDDDSRLSFLHGNYVTLTNMTDEDVQRIIKMRFSPINISIHTTNPELRVRMMKNKRAGDVLDYLNAFKRAGISMCGQIVLCKGVNDGDELLRTMRDLAELYPHLGSVSVVPAGLTKFRDKLYPLTDFTPTEAKGVIDMVDAFADQLLAKYDSRVFFAADEFYLKAGLPIPESNYYEDYPQIENGVGMIRSFSDELEDALCGPLDECSLCKLSVATGTASYGMICELTDKIMEKYPNLKINVYKITNNFFGESITVSGLLTGKDICEQLKDKPLGERLLIPENALRYGEEVFLCGMTVSELSDRLCVEVAPAPSDGYGFLDCVIGIACN